MIYFIHIYHNIKLTVHANLKLLLKFNTEVDYYYT